MQPLRAGDHLSRPEFERRYQAMPDVKKAELIEGVVYMPPPVSYVGHGRPHAALMAWLGAYWTSTRGISGGDNSSLRLDLENMPQPDAFLMILPECGGQARIDVGGYLAGAPELVAEIAASSASYDLYEKKRLYQRVGVREYLVWRVHERQIDWFVLHDGIYQLRPSDDAGICRSEVFPGLWLDPVALVNEDLPAVNQVLQRGLASPEHAAFTRKHRA